MGKPHLLVDYLATSTTPSLESFELLHLNASSNTKKQILRMLGQYLEEEASARLARWIMDYRSEVTSRRRSSSVSQSRLQPPQIANIADDKKRKLSPSSHPIYNPDIPVLEVPSGRKPSSALRLCPSSKPSLKPHLIAVRSMIGRHVERSRQQAVSAMSAEGRSSREHHDPPPQLREIYVCCPRSPGPVLRSCEGICLCSVPLTA
jgi:hypothetical protein